jgi:hypothetical protein
MSLTEYFETFSMDLMDQYRAEIYLVGSNGQRIVGTHIPTGDTIQAMKPFLVFGDVGEWRRELPPNAEISPAGTKWARDLTGSGVNPADPPIYFNVIVSGVAQNVTAHLTDPPGAIGDAALDVHALSPLLAGLHGEVSYVPDRDGVSGLTRVIMEQDGANAITASVVGRWLRFNSAAAGPQQREVWIIPGTDHEDCEAEILIGQADTLAASAAQWGLIPRLRKDEVGNLWRGYAVWTDTTIPIPTLVNHGVMTFQSPAGGSGTHLIQNLGQNGVSPALTALRYLQAWRCVRASNVSTIFVTGDHLPNVGDAGNFVSNTDTTFHITNGVVTARDRNLKSFSYAQVAGAATDNSAGGQWQPATRAATTPFVLGIRIQAYTLMSRLWRREENPPDWQDPDRVTSYTFTPGVGTPAPHSGRGSLGLWVGHLANNNLRFGDLKFKKLK